MAKTKKAAKPKATGSEDALQRVISQIEKQYGQGAIMQMDEHQYAKIEGIDIAEITVTIPATNGDKMIGPFDPAIFNQSTVVDDN